jgi:hypothetical protein
MIMNQRMRMVILFALLTLTSAVFAQGLYYESVMSGGMASNDPRPSHTYLMPKMMKTVSAEGGTIMIIRVDQETMFSIDMNAKTYWEMTFTEMEQAMKGASAKMDAQMAKLREQLKNMPEEQRKAMEQRMGGMLSTSDAPVTMTATGEQKKISGFSCTKFEAKQGEKSLMSIWTTKDVKAFDGLRKDYQALTNRLRSMNPGIVKGLTVAMATVEGFPMETDFGPMTNVVTKIESRATGIAEFTVPAGLTKVESPLKKAAQKGGE